MLSGYANTLAILFGVGAALSLVLSRWRGHALLLTLFAASASLSLVCSLLDRNLLPGSRLHVVLYACAILALSWSLVSAIVGKFAAKSTASKVFNAATWICTLGAVVPAVFMIVLRLILVLLQTYRGGPLPSAFDFAFEAGGLYSLLAATLACAILLWSTRHELLVTCLFWAIVASALWGAQLLPASEIIQPVGELARTVQGHWSLFLSLMLSLTVVGFVLAEGVVRRRRRTNRWPDHPEDLLEQPRSWPGFRLSAGTVGLALVLLECYHLAFPMDLDPGGPYLASLVVVFSSAAAGWALFMLVGRSFSENMADAAMALMSLAVCAAAVSLVPGEPLSMAERYPMVFNAVLIGLAVMTWLWHFLAGVWEQQLCDGQAWTTAGRLIPCAKRFGFMVGALGVWIGLLMAVWPRLPRIPATDDTLGRFAAGIAGNLILLLALMSSARKTNKPTLNGLTILATVSLIGFVVVRLIPYTTSRI